MGLLPEIKTMSRCIKLIGSGLAWADPYFQLDTPHHTTPHHTTVHHPGTTYLSLLSQSQTSENEWVKWKLQVSSVAKWSELVKLWSEIGLFLGKLPEFGPIYHLKLLPRASKQWVTFDWKLSATFRMFWGTLCRRDSWSLGWGFPLQSGLVCQVLSHVGLLFFTYIMYANLCTLLVQVLAMLCRAAVRGRSKAVSAAAAGTQNVTPA